MERIRTFEQMDRRKNTMRSALNQARNRAERIGRVADWTAYGELMYNYRASDFENEVTKDYKGDMEEKKLLGEHKVNGKTYHIIALFSSTST